MKRFKKLSVAIVALAMCALLGISVWAANTSDVSYSATFDKSTLCVSDAEQTATLTVNISAEVAIDSMTAQVVLPEGLELVDITCDALDNPEVDDFFFDISTGMLMWFSYDAENVVTDLIAEVTVKVPANATAGTTYKVNFKITDLSADYGDSWGSGEPITTLEATLTVAEHDWNEPTYTVTDKTHTANYTCKNDETHTKSDAAAPHDFTNGNCVCGKEKPAATTGLKGDVNLDGVVDALDLDIMVQVIPGIMSLTEPQALINADVNEDGNIDAVDLDKFVRFVPGIITDWSQE